MSNERNVKRVLVMMDYGDSDPQSGEVFDLTALALELAGKSEHKAVRIELEISTHQDYLIAELEKPTRKETQP